MGLIQNPFIQFPSGESAFDPSDISERGLDIFANDLSNQGYSDGDVINLTDGLIDLTETWELSHIGNTPTYEAGQQNGQDVIDFVAGESIRDLTSYTFGNQMTVAYSVRAKGSGLQQFLMQINGGNFLILKRSNGDIQVQASNDVISLSTGDFTPSVDETNWWNFIITVDFSSGVGELIVYLNSTNVESSATNGSADGTIIPANYWYIPASSNQQAFELGRFIVYNKILSSSERTSLMGFLNDFYIGS